MFDPKRLQDILTQQKQLLDQLEKESDIIIRSDLTKENELLKKELQQAQQFLAEKDEKLKAVTAQNREFKNALYEHIYNEKINILDNAQKTSKIYFGTVANGEINRLTQLEKNLQHRTMELKAQLEKHNCDARDAILDKLNNLVIETAEAVAKANAEAGKAYDAYSAYSNEQFNALKNEQITDEVIAAIGKKNNLEAFVGGNLINKIGVIFIILGIIAVSRFAFIQMSDVFRAIIIFAISGIFLVGGEMMNRKRPSIFSLGLTSTGVAGMYASLAISYFMFQIVGMIPALLLCILITAVAFVLSTRYNAQTIATFALVGGYFPMVSISNNAVLVYSAMGYFVILNLLALTLSFYKKWRINMFVGFTLNLFGTVFIVNNVYRLWRQAPSFQPIIAIAYIMFVFAIYTVIPIISSYRTKNAFAKAEVVLFGLNTAISAFVIYIYLWVFDLMAYSGLVALVFATVYICLGWLMRRMFVNEQHAAALFYLTGLTFVVLFVPLQLDIIWLSLGWLVQAVLLSCYGILAEHKPIKKAGYVIGGLCLAVFLVFDLPYMSWLFPYRYLAITVGSIIIMVVLAYKKMFTHMGVNIYKYAALVNGWVYSLYLVSLSSEFIRVQLYDTLFNPDFLLNSLVITVTFLFAALLPFMPAIADKGTKIISVCLYVLGILYLMFHIQAGSVVHGSPPFGIMVIVTVVLIALCGLALLAMRNVLIFFVVEAKMSVEWVPFGVSAYFLILLTQNLVVQYNMAVTSMVLSIIFVIAALVWIIFGFVKRFVFMRRFGLGLSILAVAKLFLVDLPDLTGGHRIISYFAFGVTLLGISFVYQYFSKQFALKLNEENSDV